MSQRAWKPCVNADKTGQCYYFTKKSNNRAHGLACDSNGRCEPERAGRCQKYDTENYGSVVMI